MIEPTLLGDWATGKGRKRMAMSRTTTGGASLSVRAILKFCVAIIAIGMTMTAAANAQQQAPQGSNPLTQTLQNMLSGSTGSLQQILQGQATGPQTIPPSVSTQQTIIPPAAGYPTQTGANAQTLPGPNQSMTPTQPQTRLEQIMSDRAGVPLYQFGYDQVGVAQQVTVSQVGAVQDDYILGPGDQLDVTLRGQMNADYRVTVDRDGRVLLPGLKPISAGGRRFGDFRTDIVAAMHHAFVATDSYVTVAQLRQVTVLVVGEVNNPGSRTLTGLSSPLDAILISGGVKKTGSLRNIKLIRGGREIPYDLYSILTQTGHAQPTLLADGDRIVVPPLGPTIAVTGWVRRPAIYELPPGATGISAHSLISLAGGLEVRGRYRLIALRLLRDGRQEMTQLQNESGLIRDSEILYAEPSASETVGGATVAGGQPLAGRYSISHSGKLSDLLKGPGALGSSPDAIFGIIVRRDPHTYVKSLIAFSPAAVLEGADDIDLESNDVVRIFSAAEGALLSKTVVDYQAQQITQQEAQRNPQFNNQLANLAGQGYSTVTGSAELVPGVSQVPTPAGNGMAQPAAAQTQNVTPSQLSLLQLQQQAASNGGLAQNPSTTFAGLPVVQSSSPTLLPQQASPVATPTIVNGLNLDQETVANPPPVSTSSSVQNFTQLSTQLGVDPLSLINFLIDHEVRLDGAVRSPGVYIVGPHTVLRDLVSVAGGTAHWADQSGVQLITTAIDPATGRAETKRETLSLTDATLASYTVQPRDSFRFSEVYTQVDAGEIVIQGEVRSPGNYPILHGEHLSEVLVRAGGLTDVAYPYGTVFLRQSVAALEEIGYQKAADEVQKQVLVGMGYAAQAGGNGANASAGALQGIQGFVNELRERKPLGRISIIADPSVLAAHPEKDPILEAGDVIYIPQRPSTVTVLGEVMQPGSFAVDPTKSAKDYVEMAGGYGRYSDSGWTFVVFPDGTAQQIDSSWFKFDRQSIPPGSVVYVPRDLFPLNWSVVVTDTGEIFKDLALSAAALYAISNSGIKCTNSGSICR